jgi:hypothetical protein
MIFSRTVECHGRCPLTAPTLSYSCLFLMRLDKKDSRRTGLREPAIFHVFLMLSRVDPQQRFVVQRSCFTTREQAEF